MIATSLDGFTQDASVSYTVAAVPGTTTTTPASGPVHAIGRSVPDNHHQVFTIRGHRDGTVTFSVAVPGPGRIDVLVTAWDDNLARAAIVLPPAPHRFAFARAYRLVPRAGTFHLKVTPNPRGRRLVAHPRYRVALRLWVSYTPTGGRPRSLGFYGLHLKR